jgi:hypothetical protein
VVEKPIRYSADKRDAALGWHGGFGDGEQRVERRDTGKQEHRLD